MDAISVLGSALAPRAAWAQAEPDFGARVQVALLKYLDSERRRSSYLYTYEQDERKLSPDGALLSKELNRLRYEEFEGGRALFVTHREGKPVSDYDRKWQEQQIREARAASRDPDAQDLTDAMRKLKYGAGFVKEVSAAFDFQLADRIQLRGRQTLVVDFEPREAFRPRVTFAKAFTRTRGRAWLDEEDGQLARLEAEMIGDVSFNPILGSVGRGSKFDFTQARLSAGNWQPTYERTRMIGRSVMFKTSHEEDVFRYSDYRPRR